MVGTLAYWEKEIDLVLSQSTGMHLLPERRLQNRALYQMWA